MRRTQKKFSAAFFADATVQDGFSFICRAGTTGTGGRMTISTLILILLLTFGVACVLDRFARSLQLL